MESVKMATKTDVLKVMKMDKEELIRTVNNKPTKAMGKNKIVKLFLKEFLRNTEINTDIFSVYCSDINEKTVGKKLWEDIIADEKIIYAENDAKREMKEKIEEEFKKLERKILLEGAGVVAEMLKDVLTSLKNEVSLFV
jgi:hypothetical protein